MDQTFVAPGPGSWEHDADHQASPRGRLAVELVEEGFNSGFQTFFGRYGMPLDRLEARHVNGWMYMRAVPAGVPDKGGSPPPDWVIRIVARVVPELRRRNKTAATAQAEKLWLRDADRWRTDRGGWEDRMRSLAAEDPSELSDEELGRHADEVKTLVADMAFEHFAMLGPAIGIGELLLAASEWGIEPQELAALLAGSSPASSATRQPLLALAEEIANGGTQPATVEELRAISPTAGRLVEAFLTEYGWRALSDDITSPTLAEHPETLLALIEGVGQGVAELDVEALADATRDQVPPADRAHFDELLADARSCYEVLDDNSGLLSWAVGLGRRAALEVGARLVARGEAIASTDSFLLSMDEFVNAAHGGGAPTDLGARRDLIARESEMDPPMILGDAPSPPPDMGLFPGPLARMGGAMDAYLGLKFTVESSKGSGHLSIDGSTVATGEGVGTGSATGRVIVCEDVDEALDRLEPGDILVCPVTTPAWNSLFPLLGGIVTKFGGPLGHTAVMAREFGLAAVVGVKNASLEWDGSEGVISTGK